MRNLSSRPPDQSTSSGSQGPFLSNRSTRPPSQGTYSSQIGSTTNVPPLSSEGYVVNHSDDSEHNSRPFATGGYSASLENTQNDTNDSDTEMTDARSFFDEPQEVAGISDQDIIQRVPNLFRLLDLVDEQGTGGIVEKMVIDQTSLHRLLNTIQPGSYDSVSKINFKSLDKLSIKATGLYGVRSKIIEYLKKAGCLSDDAATFLSGGVASSAVSSSILRSGLYLVLKPEAKLEKLSLKQAYIIYWPEESTWDDQAASSSVRRNRITFMRYLIKLTEQIVALVSPDQAKALVWDTGARNKDLPPDQIDNDDDASRLFSFEVSESLEQEEDATASSGFTVHADPKHFPRNADKVETKLVPGEHKAALLVSVHETSSKDHRVFSETINQMRLRKVIEASGNQPQMQLGELSLEGLICLADNGLREKYREPFQKYERHMRDLDATRSTTEAQDRRKIDQAIRRDTPMIREEIRQSVRNLYHQVYPSLNVTTNISHEPEASVSLYSRYPGLSKAEANIQRKNRFDQVSDKRFQSLKSKWILIREFLMAEPLPSETAQAEFVNDVLNAPEGIPPPRPPPPKSPPRRTVVAFGGIMWGADTGARNFVGGSYPRDTTPKPKPASLTDPQFVSEVRPLQELFPVLRELTDQIYDSLRAGLSIVEARILGEEVEKLISTEQEHLTEVAGRARRDNLRREQSQAFNSLISELREAMSTSAPHIIYVESLENLWQGNTRSGHASYRWSGRHVIWRGDRTRHCIYPLGLTEQDSQLCQSNEAHVPAPKLESRHKFEFTVDPGRSIEFLHLVRDKCLVVVSEPGKSHIYIEDNLALDQSINRKSGKVILNHHSLGGPRCLFAFDQATRLLAIVHGEKELKLSVYIFDEQFSGLRSRGSSVPLKGWYDAEVRIEKVCFVSGKEEVCLIEDTGRARVFSLITQQFRSATLQISPPIIDAFSAPDGSCLFITVADQNAQRPRDRLLAFHWASFGSNQKGIHITDLPPSDVARTVTRLEGRGRNYVLTYLSTTRSLSSVAVQVKQKATEFSFRSTQHGTQAAAAETFNNSLIDCHLEVWTRFPVVPAVSRCTLVPVSRQPRKIVFQSPVPLPELGHYFARMISTFERTTRKPMDGSLSAISVVSSVDGEASLHDGVSECRNPICTYIKNI